MESLIDVQNRVARANTAPAIGWDEIVPIQQRQLGNVVAIEYAKQFQDELIRDRETFMTVLAHGVENEKIERLIKSKIIMIDNLLKK
ncbi:hypothetical protein UFOVP916_26 [uncultured Caudovirales phage]|uniref:Uncharacterized protein n=1 Tax=uncultured Caudovirales phage TaxID=2100421 RepID=A0A6J5SI74_9CAUD|nr:hypothetical protein UFOVP827_47 [uncultured Caudovirales phage]CAB4171455.1 hypothetical protein UFOVP916_26 [uncultured Caudovirales phage]CAB4177440.1 hypothetical protein UFOVP1001_50 [uncultured Caudovirales phage]CAB4199203.1 hypothetical protein UFOVP1338_26 [uncultured Caudovirales phage]CAB4213391.1 hypothetical protein UFOVP1447_21 [uncultured Caudovirales phage]